MAKRKATFTVEVEFDPQITDADALARALDILMETATSTPEILDDYGNPTVGEFFPLRDAARPSAVFGSLNRVNWDLLHRQKDALVELRSRQRDPSPEFEALTGVIRVLDDLQDEAVRAGLWPPPPTSEPARRARGRLRWRCARCGTLESLTDDPVELAQTGTPMCGECDQEMDPCATELQPVLDELRCCACLLGEIAGGDTVAVERAADAAQESVVPLRAYGEQAQWMNNIVAAELPATDPKPSKRHYVEDDDGRHYGPLADHAEAADVAEAIHGRIISQDVDAPEDEGEENAEEIHP